MLNDEIIKEVLSVIEEQSEFIMREADRVNRLSALLLQQAEIDAPKGKEDSA